MEVYTMNKGELIEKYAEKTGETKAASGKAVDALLDSIKTGLKKSGEVAIAGFGSFRVERRAAREGRNPKTGEKIKIPAKKVVKFTAGKTLKEHVAG
jgi:DNA-binding protein HU-beta